MTFADWVIVGICTVLVLLLGGLPEQVTDQLVSLISTHRPIPIALVKRVVQVEAGQECAYAPDRWPSVIDAFNRGIYLGRLSMVYLPNPTRYIELASGPGNRTVQLFPFRNETGVLLLRGRRRLFYLLRMEEAPFTTSLKGKLAEHETDLSR